LKGWFHCNLVDIGLEAPMLNMQHRIKELFGTNSEKKKNDDDLTVDKTQVLISRKFPKIKITLPPKLSCLHFDEKKVVSRSVMT